MPLVHQTFNNLVARQQFHIDDVIGEMTRIRDIRLKMADADIKKIKENKNTRPMSYASQTPLSEIEMYNRALHAAEKLKDLGETLVLLNPTQDLRDQILALAYTLTKDNNDNDYKNTASYHDGLSATLRLTKK